LASLNKTRSASSASLKPTATSSDIFFSCHKVFINRNA
jgi:hypothetical protein